MKERGIIFSAPMVRAILAGEKTMTRRIMNPQPVKQSKNAPWVWLRTAWCDGGSLISDRAPVDFCPYGQPGDRLWVRETWATVWRGDGPAENPRDDRVEYRADGDPRRLPGGWPDDCRDDPDCGRWRPSIYMPRWASRITLDVTGVRIERLHEITPSDAMAEGVGGPSGPQSDLGFRRSQDRSASPVNRFCELWRSIYGEGSWSLNPWVWVVSFERVKGGAS